jgi:integrase/recombinase XerD
MIKFNPRNERIKKAYFHLLKEADQKGTATVDGVRKALLRYEQFTRFADFAGFNSGEAVSFKRHLTALKAVRSGAPLSGATILSTLHAIQDFFRWLSREPGYKSRINAADIRYLNLSHGEVAAARSSPTRKVPTIEQIRAAIEAMPAKTEIEMRDRAVVAFIAVTGIRDRAVAALRLKHIDLDERLVIQDPKEVPTKFSKRIETYFFPVGEDFEQIVIDWARYLREVQLFGSDDPLFPRTKVAANEEMLFAVQGIEPVFWSSAAQIRGVFKDAFAAAGLPHFTPHSFRSTLAVLGQRICKGDAELLKAWSQNLGHVSMLTTLTSYGHVALHRQGELVRNAGKKEPDDDRLDRVVRMLERLQLAT